ncbi:MAG: killer suppression protein [Anaerolineae bacterium]
MDIAFGSTKLQKTLNTQALLVKAHGPKRAQRIRQRLDDMAAAGCLQEMERLPGRCHELKGNRAGQLALDLDHPYRLIFKPDHDPVPIKSDGGLDWQAVTSVVILGIEDYHG